MNVQSTSDIWRIALCVVLLSSFTSCRGMGALPVHWDAEPQTGHWWAKPLPTRTPISPQERTVWMQDRHPTPQGLIQQEQLRQGFAARGYTLTEEPEQANFHLFLTIRFFGKNPKRDGGKTVAAELGTLTSDLVGATLTSMARPQTLESFAAGVGSIVAGNVINSTVNRYSQFNEYDLIVDVHMAQRQGTTLLQTRGARVPQITPHPPSAQEDDRLRSENRLVLWARHIRLTPEDAKRLLAIATARSLPLILP